jgi:hypothetical protein
VKTVTAKVVIQGQSGSVAEATYPLPDKESITIGDNFVEMVLLNGDIIILSSRVIVSIVIEER